jgi:hypothetical protein
MPRRSPSELRFHLPKRYQTGHSPQIPGLSASANRQIAAFERVNRLEPGEVFYSFRRWALANRRRSPYGGDRCDDFDDPDDWRAGDCHVRSLLDYAVKALRRKARRELRTALQRLDDRYLARTVNNPFARRDLPWWKRRIEL